MVCVAKTMCGVEVWAWKELGKVYRRVCKSLMGVPNCATSGFAEMELVREISGEASS
jgi:hypothetical protein